MRTRVVLVTPKLAREWLEKNDCNRPLSLATVARYAADMRAGKWELNGETIIFSKRGLLDGQHRLHAVIEADVSVEMLVVHDVECRAFSTIDSGKARTFADVLGIDGHKNASVLASSVNLLDAYERGNPFLGGTSSTKSQLAEV